jgi:hypothetical protein
MSSYFLHVCSGNENVIQNFRACNGNSNALPNFWICIKIETVYYATHIFFGTAIKIGP